MSKTGLPICLVISLATCLTACGKNEPAEPPAATPETAASAAADSTPATPHPMPAQAEATVDLSGIEKAADGMTVAEVFADKDQIGGQTVIVRGKVVKTNAGIMGRNWLHVRDGSGVEGTNDLAVTTTAALPEVGDTVIVTGPVSVDKDFGMGYAYPVIVEGAEVTVEDSGGN